MQKDNIIKQGIEKFQLLNNRTSVTAESVQRSIKECGLNKHIEAILLFLAARLLRKKGAYSVIIAYFKLGATWCFTRPCIWEWLVRITIGDDSSIGSTIISFIKWWDGGIDYFVFGTLTLVTIIVAIFNGIVEIQKARVHKELKEILNAITFSPDLEWFDIKCKNAIVKLGDRYSEDNNFKNPKLENVYRALIKPEYWSKDFRNSIKAFAIAASKSYNALKEECKKSNTCIKSNIDTIVEIFNSKDEARFATIFNLIEQIMQSFNDILFHDEGVYSRYDFNKLTELKKSLDDFNPLCQYISKPVVYVKGHAGTG